MARDSFSRYQSYTILKTRRKKIFQFLKVFFTLYIIYLLVNAVFLRTISIGSVAMEPGIPQGSMAIFTPLPLGGNNLPFLFFGAPGWRDPQRAEVVEVNPGFHKASPPWIQIADDLVRFFTFNMVTVDQSTRKDWDQISTIKRVVGLPGDTLRMDNFVIYVKPKGQDFFFSEFEIGKKTYQLKKPELPGLWKSEFPFSGKFEELTLGENEYFVLNDNRTIISDSRSWGPLKRNAFKSVGLIKYWPFAEIRGL